MNSVFQKSNLKELNLLGQGGQGEVYRVAMPDGEEKALKWYFPASATPAQWRVLQRLIRKGSPSSDYLWPESLVEGDNRFGYVMEVRPPEYRSIIELMTGKVDPSFRVIARVGMNLSRAFLALHSRGLCYGDISFGNIFFHPQSGAVKICDNDNVVVDGSDDMGVMGTPRFMAPEIVCGEALPSSDTDRYSLAVLLFYLLMVHHPLEGKKERAIHCMDLPAMELLYGREPVFIFDPDDQSNRPVDGVQDLVQLYWGLYPGFIQELFTQAFTVGLKDAKHGRVRESLWCKAMAQLLDSIFLCSCGAENFYDLDELRRSGKLKPCWSCKKTPQLTARMRVNDQLVVLAKDTMLFDHHLRRIPGGYELCSPRAVVEARQRKLMLKNMGDNTWSAAVPGEQAFQVEPGKALGLRDGMKIYFGEVVGQVRIG